jgi:hypothetical protein
MTGPLHFSGTVRKKNSARSSTTTDSAGPTIEGLRTAPRLEDAEGVEVLAANWKTAGSFECSNELFNRMHKVNLWTLLMLSQSGFICRLPAS